MTDRDELLSQKKVAYIFGRSLATVARWMDEGLLKYVKLPSGVRMVRQSEVNRHLVEREGVEE